MRKNTLISTVLLALAQVTQGQSSAASVSASATSSSTSATSTRAAATFKITVGNSNQFQPDVTTALPGDTIEFDFMPLNHSVVRAEYKYPCIPYEKTGTGKVGFFSGFHPVDTILANPPTWTLQINDTNPIFLYCSAPGACINYGMVAVINPNASVSLATQRQMAMDSKYMLQPGEDFPAESSSTVVSSSASATSTSSSASSPSTVASATVAPSSQTHKSGLPAGTIAGIVIGGIIVIALAASLFFFIGRTKTLEENIKRQSEIPKTDMYPSGPNGYYSVHPPDFQRHSQISAGYDGSVPPYGSSPNMSQNGQQYPKPGLGQPGWQSPTGHGSGSPPPPQHVQPVQQQGQGGQQIYSGAAPGTQIVQLGNQGGIPESAQKMVQDQRSSIVGMGAKQGDEPTFLHELYAPSPKKEHRML